MSHFELKKQTQLTRLGSFRTIHGSFDTPNFMPVGTKASVKGVTAEQLEKIGTQITLVNTYHLWLRPGHELIKALGGIHKFAGWNGPILSDSGGFQVFSLQCIRKLSEEGVEFQSHIDGSRQFLTPELSIQIQEALGVDIAMAFDECPSGKSDFLTVEKSLQLTLRWAERCLQARRNPEQTSLFGITQGGMFKDLRTRSIEALSNMPFDGYAIGGLSVGETKTEMYEVLSYHPQQLPADKIRYLMGVGTPRDIIEAVNSGVDLFDCVMPTRSGRFGRAFISGAEPYINIKNNRFKNDPNALDENCKCTCCQRYSRAYIHHLFKVDEMLGPILLSIHNLRHYLELMAQIRICIANDTFQDLYQQEAARWQGTTIGGGLIGYS